MTRIKFFFGVILLEVYIVYATHFRGGTITWRPVNATPNGLSADFLIRERYSWRRGFPDCGCTDATIASKGLIGPTHYVKCTAPTPAGSYYSVNLDVSSGERTRIDNYPLNIAFTIYYTEAAWLSFLVKGKDTDWYVANRVNTNLRPDGYINTSPVAVTLPIIYKQVGIQHVHVVQMSDFDGSDTLKCRWANASSTVTQYDECGGICEGVPGAKLIPENCTIVFTLTTPGWYAGVALQIEDYFTSTSPTPMSSVPLQFLFYGYPAPTGCSTPPEIIGNRPDRACIGTPIGSNVTEYIIVQTFCPGQTIDDFITSSPIGMTKSDIFNPSPGIYHLILSWIPQSDQYGPEPFCAGAIDNGNLQSNQWCFTFLVGFESPDIIRPTIVQGSVSPIGTVFQNQTVFSFQTTKAVDRPKRNGTTIYFRDAANDTAVAQFDCGWAPEVTFTGFTTVIRFVTVNWEPGHFYYITMDGGTCVVSGTEFCGPESAPITDKTYWVFNIWNPAASSTTTTTTTPFTTVTVTTKPTSTTSINTLLTTTGIVITSTTPVTTTATTAPATTTALTTTGPTASSATTGSTFSALSPKDFEEGCKQPIALMTSLIFIVMMPIHSAVVYAAFTKMEKMFNPSHIQARTRHKQRMKRIL
ncbi:hypothetical protein I4U23_005796 [Adineta vaga]|nr:hypothetical protein I4U23_005796 [Adineta vaga]